MVTPAFNGKILSDINEKSTETCIHNEGMGINKLIYGCLIRKGEH
jgi:hypothetical protein